MSRLARALSALAVAASAVISTSWARAELPAPPLLWRFQTASPVSAAPALAPSGNVYLAGVEGVVHALAPDGRLRWSHGVSGMPIGEPVLDGRERVYLATSADRMYSFHADGRLRWRREARARLRSGAMWLEPSRILFLAGGPGHAPSLHGLSSWGEAQSRLLASAAGLFAAAPGEVAALASGRRGLELWRWRAGARSRLPLPAQLAAGEDLQLLVAGERLWLLFGGELHALQPGNSRSTAWSAPARHAAVSSDSETVLVDTGTELRWLGADSGEERRRLPLTEATSAAPAVGNDGLALVPLVSGELLLARPGRVARARFRVGSAPLLRPIWSEPAQRAAVAAGDGSLVVLQLSDSTLPDSPRPLSEPGAAARSAELRQP